MIKNENPQEKLLVMLSDIYEQLEELEAVLETSLSDLRSNLHEQHTTKMTIAEEKLSTMEQVYYQNTQIKSREGKQIHPQSLKLELGF